MKMPETTSSIAERLEKLMQQHGVSSLLLSKALNRNPAYIQQFIKRGTPRKLDEADRVILGRYFGVSPDHFAPADIANPQRRTLGDVSLRLGIIDVPRFDIRASAGAGMGCDAYRAATSETPARVRCDGTSSRDHSRSRGCAGCG